MWNFTTTFFTPRHFLSTKKKHQRLYTYQFFPPPAWSRRTPPWQERLWRAQQPDNLMIGSCSFVKNLLHHMSIEQAIKQMKKKATTKLSSCNELLTWVMTKEVICQRQFQFLEKKFTEQNIPELVIYLHQGLKTPQIVHTCCEFPCLLCSSVVSSEAIFKGKLQVCLHKDYLLCLQVVVLLQWITFMTKEVICHWHLQSLEKKVIKYFKACIQLHNGLKTP